MNRKLVLAVVTVATVSMMLLFAANGIPPAAAQSSKTIDLSNCKFDVGLADAKRQVDAKCGVLQVPEDRTNANSRKIDIHVVVLAATKQEGKGLPIFHLEGGPGGAAIQDFGAVWYGPYRILREDHDIVLIDQRGTGTSASLQCTEITEPIFADLAQPINEKADNESLIKRLDTCFNRLAATNDPAFYTSTIMADDTDAVREALGYDQIDVFGNSYGTWLGQIYLRRHGEHVHGMVLDSIVGPWNNVLIDSANSTQASLDKVFALCENDPACDKVYPDLPGKLKTALEKLDAKPGTAFGLGMTGQTYTVTVTRARLLQTIQLMLYQSANLGMLPQVISDAANGNYTLTATTLAVALEQLKDLSQGLYFSVNCSESVPFVTDALAKQYLHGNFYNTDDKIVENMQAICKIWRSAELSDADVAPVKSDRPVLILSGVFDPVTPVSYGEEAHLRLTKSTLAVFPYQGHGPMATNKCAQTMVAAFFKAPDQPVDTSCTAKDIKPIFNNTFQVDLIPFTDPGGAYTTVVPKDWRVDGQSADGKLTFLSSPDDLQLLGIGLFKNTKAADAQKAALKAIEEKYGPVEVQYTQSILFISFTQLTIDRPNESYIGALLFGGLGGNTTVVLQAAPANMFSAVLLPIATPIFTSVLPK